MRVEDDNLTDHTELKERNHPELHARMPIYRRGKGYVGKKAAADRQFVNDVFQTLNREWSLSQGQGQVRRIASYC